MHKVAAKRIKYHKTIQAKQNIQEIFKKDISYGQKQMEYIKADSKRGTKSVRAIFCSLDKQIRVLFR